MSVVHRATFGLRGRSRTELVTQLEGLLGIVFERRESSYLGEYETFRETGPSERPGDLTIRVRDNRDPTDGLRAVEASDASVLLEIAATDPERFARVVGVVEEQLGAEPL